MSLFMEIETDRKLPFDARKIAELVIETSLDYVKCPYETEVSLLLTTDEEIKEINRMQRQIDRATDVLSFPMADYETPGDFSHLDEDAGLFHPDTGELMLGDIVISVDKVNHKLEVPSDEANLDGLNFLAGKRVDEVNKMAELGTMIAHIDL